MQNRPKLPVDVLPVRPTVGGDCGGRLGLKRAEPLDESLRASETLTALTIVVAELVLRLGIRDVEVQPVVVEQPMRQFGLPFGFGTQDSPTPDRQAARCAEALHPVSLDRVHGRRRRG